MDNAPQRTCGLLHENLRAGHRLLPYELLIKEASEPPKQHKRLPLLMWYEDTIYVGYR